MKNKEMIYASIKIQKKDDTLLKKIAIAKGKISKSNMIRMAITEYIERNKYLINEKSEK